MEKNKKYLIEFTFQQILTEYFKSSKHTKEDINLASACRTGTVNAIFLSMSQLENKLE